MFPAHVCAHIRHVFGTVMAVRAIKPRQLAALEFRVIIKIVLVTEDTRTLGTRKLRFHGGEIAAVGSGASDAMACLLCTRVVRHREHDALRQDEG